jgi:hypothetical protein
MVGGEAEEMKKINEGNARNFIVKYIEKLNKLSSDKDKFVLLLNGSPYNTFSFLRGRLALRIEIAMDKMLNKKEGRGKDLAVVISSFIKLTKDQKEIIINKAFYGQFNYSVRPYINEIIKGYSYGADIVQIIVNGLTSINVGDNVEVLFKDSSKTLSDLATGFIMDIEKTKTTIRGLKEDDPKLDFIILAHLNAEKKDGSGKWTYDELIEKLGKIRRQPVVAVAAPAAPRPAAPAASRPASAATSVAADPLFKPTVQARKHVKSGKEVLEDMGGGRRTQKKRRQNSKKFTQRKR